jgi:ParB family transcriptional regulator, chromosome partitioning protein
VTKERRLGRGLEALLGRKLETSIDAVGQDHGTEASTSISYASPSSPTEPDSPEPDLAHAQTKVTRSEDGQQWIQLNDIERNPYQPRQSFDESEIADLCDSIRTHGFLQPIVVRNRGDSYQLIAGERRMRAAEMAGWERVPVLIRDVDDRQMAELAIVENVQRKDLNALEKGASFHRYLEEYRCTQEELASRVNIDRSTIANLIRLLELPNEVKQMLTDKQITHGHARTLLPLGEAEEQISFAKRIHQEGLSVRVTEEAVRDHIHRADAPGWSVIGQDGRSRPAKPPRNENLATLEEQLKLALGTKVDLRQTAKGRGRLTIHFKSNDEFERIRALICTEATASEPTESYQAG